MKAVTIWVTEECNLRCTYCYEGKEKRNKSFSENNIDKLVYFIETMMVGNSKDEYFIISFHGGEPLLKLSLIRAVVLAADKLGEKHKLNIIYELTTNGTISKEVFLKLIGKRKDFRLSVSIDGVEKTNDLYRKTDNNEGSFIKAFEFACDVEKAGLEPRIRMTVIPKTVNQLYVNTMFFIERGFNKVVAVPDFFDNKWNRDDIEELELQIRKIYNWKIKSNNSRLQIGVIDDFLHLRGVGVCTGGQSEIHINVEGELYPCSYTINNAQYCVGNIWDGIDYQKQSALKEIYLEENQECEGCTLKNICICTRCKFLNEKIVGDLNTAVPIICHLTGMKFRINRDVNTNSWNN